MTKTGEQLHGIMITRGVGSAARGSSSYGRPWSRRQSSFAISALVSRAAGAHSTPEFSEDSGTRGTVRGLDWESGGQCVW